MFDIFRKDAQRWVIPSKFAEPSEVTFLKVLSMLYRYPSLRMMLWFRLARWCKDQRIPAIPNLLYQVVFHRFGAELRLDTPIGGGLYIAHPAGVVISPDSMGENCSVIAAVTIGMRNEFAFPKIGDRVFIGAGARVLGNIKLGDDVQVGANSVVVKDTPAGSTVVGIPGRIISIYGEKPQSPNS
jgi:serine O-acetyltransferase